MNCRPCTVAGITVGLAATALLTMGLAPAFTATTSVQSVGTTAAPARPAAAGVLTCTVDDTHSLALFRIHHGGAGQFWGRFNAVEGTFSFTPGSAEGMKFDVVIKTDSVDTGVDNLDQHLKSADFFAVKDFPEMKFVSTGAKSVGKDMYEVAGDLTIRGVTKPVKANIEFTGMAPGRGGDKAGFEATLTVRRGDFGVSYGLDKGGLGSDVRVVVSLEGAVKAPAAGGTAAKKE